MAGDPLVDRSGWALAATLIVLFAVVGGIVTAIFVGFSIAAAGRVRHLAPIVVLASGFLASAPVVVLEWYRDYSDGPDWPSRFAWTTPFAWIAVATVVVAMVFRGPLRPRREAGRGDPAG